MLALWNLLTSPLGRVVVALIMFFAWTAYQRHDAAREARAECQAEQLKKTITEISRQRDAAKEALTDAREQSIVTATEMTRLQTDHDQLQRDYEDAKESCQIPEPAIERMRSIR